MSFAVEVRSVNLLDCWGNPRPLFLLMLKRLKFRINPKKIKVLPVKVGLSILKINFFPPLKYALPKRGYVASSKVLLML